MPKAGRTATGRFKKTKGKNKVAQATGRKGHRISCRKTDAGNRLADPVWVDLPERGKDRPVVDPQRACLE